MQVSLKSESVGQGSKDDLFINVPATIKMIPVNIEIDILY